MAKLYVQNTKEVLNSTASLASSASISASHFCEGYSKLVGIIRTNASSVTGSGLSIRQAISPAAATSGCWDYITTCQLSACTSAAYTIDIVGAVVQVFYKTDSAASILRTRFYLRPE